MSWLTHEVNYRTTIDLFLRNPGDFHVIEADLGLMPEVYQYGIICSIAPGGQDPNMSNNYIEFGIP